MPPTLDAHVTKLLALILAAVSFAASGPIQTSRPTVTGALRVGAKLGAKPGSWSGRGAIAYAYQWSRCDARGARCGSIHGATGGSYVEVAADAGHTLALTVRATDATGTTAGYAPLAGLVAALHARIAATAQPALGGEAIVGSSLTVAEPLWSEAAGAPTYRWLACNANVRACSLIAGAQVDTYTVAAADAGRTLVAVVSASKQSVLSAASPVVRSAPGPVPVGRPTISGRLQEGKQLTGGAGTWAGSGSIAYAYQWSRCDAGGAHCATIRGATRTTYTQVAADVSHTLALTVRATDTAGLTTAYSSLAGLVAARDAAVVARTQPSLGGIPSVGQTLSVQGGTYTGSPATFAYAWLLQRERSSLRRDPGRRDSDLRDHAGRSGPRPRHPSDSRHHGRRPSRAHDGGHDSRVVDSGVRPSTTSRTPGFRDALSCSVSRASP